MSDDKKTQLDIFYRYVSLLHRYRLLPMNESTHVVEPEMLEQTVVIGLQLRRMTSKQQDKNLDHVAADVAAGVYAKHAAES